MTESNSDVDLSCRKTEIIGLEGFQLLLEKINFLLLQFQLD